MQIKSGNNREGELSNYFTEAQFRSYRDGEFWVSLLSTERLANDFYSVSRVSNNMLLSLHKQHSSGMKELKTKQKSELTMSRERIMKNAMK